MIEAGRPWLIGGGVLSAIAAALHIAIIVGGPSWYRFFGAGEGMARAAARGDWHATAITLAIAFVLAIWAAYGFSGAGLLPRLPLLRPGLVVIAGIYLLRGLAIVPLALLRPGQVNAFLVWSSLIVLVYGSAYAIGTWRAWDAL